MFKSCMSESRSLGVSSQSAGEVESGVVMTRNTELILYGEKQGEREKCLAFRTNLKSQVWHFLVTDPCGVILPPCFHFLKCIMRMLILTLYTMFLRLDKHFPH